MHVCTVRECGAPQKTMYRADREAVNQFAAVRERKTEMNVHAVEPMSKQTHCSPARSSSTPMASRPTTLRSMHGMRPRRCWDDRHAGPDAAGVARPALRHSGSRQRKPRRSSTNRTECFRCSAKRRSGSWLPQRQPPTGWLSRAQRRPQRHRHDGGSHAQSARRVYLNHPAVSPVDRALRLADCALRRWLGTRAPLIGYPA